MNLLAIDWDEVEELIEKMLNDRMRTWGWYDYFVIDNSTVLIKVYDDCPDTYYLDPKSHESCVGRLMFTIKAKLTDKGLEPVEVL